MLGTLLSDLRFRLRALFRRTAVEREMDEELRFHVEQEASKYVLAGDSPDEALRKARAAFGGVERIKDDTRDARGLALLDTITQDLRYAARGLRATPGFTFAVVATLALGIGANAAVFGVLDRLMFRPAAYLRDPGSVHRVYLATTFRGQPFTYHNFEFKRYLDLVGATHSFDQVAAFARFPAAIGTGPDVAEAEVGIASAGFFAFFNARPALGRFYSSAEDSMPAGTPVVVLDHAYWQSHYQGRTDVLGSTIQIGPMTATIIGVAPAGFTGLAEGRAPIAWVPITFYAYARRPNYYLNYNWGWLEMIVRRKDGVRIEAATEDLTAAFRQSWLTERAMDGSLTPLEIARPHVILAPTLLQRGPEAGPAARIGFWIGGVALIVLLVAAANVANLLLARAFRRRREIAVRLALGVSRRRLLGHLLTESLLLAALGGAAGLVVAWIGGGVLARVFTTDLAPAAFADSRIVVFCALVTLAVGVVTGLAPAVPAGRGDLVSALKAGAREGSYQRSRLRALLVVVQGALSVVLLIGAGLFVRSFARVQAVPLGYDVAPVLYVQRNMRGVAMPEEQQAALNRRLLFAAAALPGVVSATEAVSVPFYNFESRGLYVPGIDSVSKLGRFQLQAASPDYFRTMGTRIVAGRGISMDDRRGASPIIVVSETMASRLWPGVTALGKCVRVGADTAPCRTVVGIAEDIRQRDLSEAGGGNYYLSADQLDEGAYGLLVRVQGRAADQAETIRRGLQREMPGVSYVTTVPLSQIIGDEQRPWRTGATMFLTLGGLALVVAALGLYSVIAYNVTQRTQELGVRIALGATLGDVVRLVLSDGMRLALAGIVAGAILAFVGARWIAGLLFAVSPRDPAVFGAVAIMLAVTAVLASLLPALRAARVDPNLALRVE
ncbi:MAG TPA: ADOP family duplicated permease [Gemmatimonadales bacterium]|nr:ADOP family duplicated permease [Gemmatimonadales bacterium]